MILRFVRLDDFDTDHQTETANVANHRVAFLQLGQFTFQPLAPAATLSAILLSRR